MRKSDVAIADHAGAGEAAPKRGPLVRPSGLVDDVYEALLDRLMDLTIQPGAKITVDSLARELGVSQTPIREALARLEAEGLVLKTHLIGYSAAPQLSDVQVEELFDLRLLLEPAAAGKAAARMTDDLRRQLEALERDMMRLRDNESRAYGHFARKDAEFHALIATASGNSLLADAVDRLHTHIHIFRLVFHTRVTSEAIAEHADLLRSLKSGDRTASEKAMRAHIAASRSRILGLVRRAP